MNLLRRLRAALGIKTALQKIYAASVLSGPVEGLAKYPPKDFLGKQGVYAYNLDFVLANASGLVASIRNYFPSVDPEVFQQGSHVASNGEAIHFSIHPEFRGVAVEILTNSVDLLRAIDALQLQSPPPWTLFPYLEPDFKGAMQGEFDYWWTLYWKPFWDAASPSEKEQYMHLHQPSEAWDGYLKFRDLLVSPEFLEFLDQRDK